VAEVDLNQAYLWDDGPLPIEADWPEGVVGYRAVYRIGFAGMEVPGLPTRLRVGRVVLLATQGPIVTRQTRVVQRPGAPLTWDKTEIPAVVVGEGLPLLIGHVAAFLPQEEGPQADFQGWRDEIHSAVGLVACLLDDRVGHSEVFDDFLVFDESGSLGGLADWAGNVRNYLPFELAEGETEALESLAAFTGPANAAVAARWYLRAAQTGPSADGLALLWTSLEALTQTEGRKVVSKVEEAVQAAGEDPDALEPPLGRIWGERAQVVHFGETGPTDVIVKGWYVLERVVRLLLRRAIGLDTAWPTDPGNTDAVPTGIRELWSNTQPQTEWHDPPA
jgi:hypothetical protein